jgi:SNF2 family DNA or RNA helicase
MKTTSSDAPVMPTFHATTHKAQMAKILESIPEGCDTRRTSSQKKDLDEARQIFGLRKIQVIDGKWRLKGMNTFFKDYQLTAASWMMKRECGRTSPYGGIIADDMGMGKTFVALSCIGGNPPDKEDIKKFSKATLVLVPNMSTAHQWESEVTKHCKSPIATSVLVYSPHNKISHKQYARRWVV